MKHKIQDKNNNSQSREKYRKTMIITKSILTYVLNTLSFANDILYYKIFKLNNYP